MELTAVLTPAEEGGYVAFNPETGTTTEGESIEEALTNLREATTLYLEAFDGPATARRFYGLQLFLEDLLELPVDLVTGQALGQEHRPAVEADAITPEASPRRDWRLYAQDMQRFAHRAVGFCAGLDRAKFEANHLIQDAVLRNLELIGEAATRIPGDVRLAHAEIPWQQIIAMRNQLIHAYL
jgi:uncharacterized protein with HEPN domain/predicted RNase H-like HicB family nuclease